jgi:hypothetical protein
MAIARGLMGMSQLPLYFAHHRRSRRGTRDGTRTTTGSLRPPAANHIKSLITVP